MCIDRLNNASASIFFLRDTKHFQEDLGLSAAPQWMHYERGNPTMPASSYICNYKVELSMRSHFHGSLSTTMRDHILLLPYFYGYSQNLCNIYNLITITQKYTLLQTTLDQKLSRRLKKLLKSFRIDTGN